MGLGAPSFAAVVVGTGEPRPSPSSGSVPVTVEPPTLVASSPPAPDATVSMARISSFSRKPLLLRSNTLNTASFMRRARGRWKRECTISSEMGSSRVPAGCTTLRLRCSPVSDSLALISGSTSASSVSDSLPCLRASPLLDRARMRSRRDFPSPLPPPPPSPPPFATAFFFPAFFRALLGILTSSRPCRRSRCACRCFSLASRRRALSMSSAACTASVTSRRRKIARMLRVAARRAALVAPPPRLRTEPRSLEALLAWLGVRAR